MTLKNITDSHKILLSRAYLEGASGNSWEGFMSRSLSEDFEFLFRMREKISGKVDSENDSQLLFSP